MFPFGRRPAPPEPERPGLHDRLLTLPDCELDVARIVEGACANHSGIPLDANPWPRNYPPLWQGWRRGWIGAALHRDLWQQSDSEKWLCTPSREDIHDGNARP